jgi:hypothetical protein
MQTASKLRRMQRKTCGLALVEPGDDGAPEPKELEAKPVGAPPGPRLDQLERLQGREQPVHRAARLADKIREAAGAELALLRERVEEQRGLAQYPYRVATLHDDQ